MTVIPTTPEAGVGEGVQLFRPLYMMDKDVWRASVAGMFSSAASRVTGLPFHLTCISPQGYESSSHASMRGQEVFT